jgi:ribosome biogenesis protein MAK21
MAEMKGNNGKAPRRRGRKGKSQLEQKQISRGGGDDYNYNSSNNSNNEVTISSSVAYKPHHTLLIHLTEETPTWHQCGRNTQFRNDTVFSLNNNKKKPITNPHHVVNKYRSLADSIYQQEVQLYRSSSSNGSGNLDKDEQWVENTMKRGTLKDRIAAMSVVVGSHPVHKLYALDMLLNLAGVSTGERNHSSQTNDRVSQMASEALTDLFTTTLLPPNRKLIGMEARPLYLFEESEGKSKLSISPRILLLWRYEEILKNKFLGFLTQYLGRTLAQSGTASLDLTKINCVRTACTLLKETPEGEQILLSLVVNKIGDPSKKVAAAAAHEMRRILEVHPNMTNVIAREVS